MQELDEMKRRLKEMEEEANALREMQTKVAKEMQGQCCRTPCVELPFRGDGLILWTVLRRFGEIRDLWWCYGLPVLTFRVGCNLLVLISGLNLADCVDVLQKYDLCFLFREIHIWNKWFEEW